MPEVRRSIGSIRLPFTVLCVLLAVVGLFGMSARAQSAELPPLPPLTDPATEEQLIGKFVWADLVSNDIAASRAFYEGLLGWEWRWVSSRSSCHEADDQGIAAGVVWSGAGQL